LFLIFAVLPVLKYLFFFFNLAGLKKFPILKFLEFFVKEIIKKWIIHGTFWGGGWQGEVGYFLLSMWQWSSRPHDSLLRVFHDGYYRALTMISGGTCVIMGNFLNSIQYKITFFIFSRIIFLFSTFMFLIYKCAYWGWIVFLGTA